MKKLFGFRRPINFAKTNLCCQLTFESFLWGQHFIEVAFALLTQMALGSNPGSAEIFFSTSCSLWTAERPNKLNAYARDFANAVSGEGQS